MIPIRWRLTIFHAITTLVIAGGLVLGVFLVMISAAESEVGDRARVRAEEAAEIIESGGTFSDADLVRISGTGVDIVVRDASGTPLLRTPNAIPDRIDQAEEVWQIALRSGQPAGDTISVVSTMFPEPNPELRTYERVFVHAVPVSPTESDARVVEARIPYDSVGRSLLPVAPLAGLAVVASLLAIAGSYSLARRAFAPVNAIVETTREISESNLSRRLPIRTRWRRDEISRLAATFNDLLDRLEVGFKEREALLERQRQFVADASHELRTPLTSVLGYTRLLKHWGLEHPETARESVEAIEHQAAQMHRLVEDLLRLARGDDLQALDRERCDLQEILERAAETGSTLAEGKVTINLEPASRPVMALIDENLIYQAVMVLVDNAIRYTPQGGTVTLSTRVEQGRPEISVSDTGIGIPAEHLPHLFDRFYQVDRARSSGGSGLGLAIARQIVDAHNGTLTVDSVSGQGSTFRIVLPSG